MDFFSGIIGHERPVAVLGKALAMGNLHHAYLFLGPGGVGRDYCPGLCPGRHPQR